MNARRIQALLQELIDENPFAIRALLKIVAVEFTTAVPTLAVTNEDRPRLLINLEFVARECRSDEHVKAALCHEFLHVLLRHTSIKGPLTPARHLALDAVINAIIHRQLGSEHSSLFANYYRDAQGLMKLLRPMTDAERQRCYDLVRQKRDPIPAWWLTWKALLDGTVIADDIEQLANDLAGQPMPAAGDLIGNHVDDEPLSPAIEEALDRARQEFNGGGIWRSAGCGGNDYKLLVLSKQAAMAHWKARTLAVLRKHLVSAPGAPSRPVAVQARLPVLSPSDRRAFLRATWSPFLPEASWAATTVRPEGRAQVYLDVSGSMNAEMPLVVSLLGHLSAWIRRPFWAFSTEVVPAVIERGALKAATSGGTSLSCVLKHVAKTRPACAVIVTDGYIETIRPEQLAKTAATRLHAIVTRDGNPSLLRKAGIPYSQLGRLPK